MPRDIIPTKHDSSNTDPILTASPEMKSPGNPAGQITDDKPMQDAHSEYDTQGAEEASDTDEGSQSRPGNIAYSLFRDHRDEMEVELSQRFKNNDDLHPYVQVLSISDIDGCCAVENAAFPEESRASREKLIYRLTTCPYICLGIFSSTATAPTPKTQAMYDAARAPDSSKPNHKALLIGHVIATLTTSPVVTEESMDLPVTFPSHPDFDPHAASSTPSPVLERAPSVSLPDSAFPRTDQSSNAPGHHPLGRTIAIHSVAIHPAYQKLGLGKTMFKAYLQRMEGSGIADRAAILSKDEHVGFYTLVFGFENVGASKVKFGGGDWKNLTYDFQDSNNWG